MLLFRETTPVDDVGFEVKVRTLNRFRAEFAIFSAATRLLKMHLTLYIVQVTE